ncbi:MAG: NAD(P)-dependent oxidoreductase [Pseudomonadota bacterium]|nr:NAD(P)-dependent oxidoreductase [Pseudomonadota bacterium]
MRILVTGASSFVGVHFCSLAASQGHDVLGLWRNTPMLVDGVKCITADVTSFSPAKVDVVVHLAAKVMAKDAREQNRKMMDAVLEWGFPVVYASSTMVHWPRKNAYAESRVEDEARVRASGKPWLIVRPCAPWGPAHATHKPTHVESFATLAKLVRRAPFVPVPGSADVLRQPVHVHDFNGAILALLERGVWNAAYDAGGPEAISVREIIKRIAAASNDGDRRVRILEVPEVLAKIGGRFLKNFSADTLATFATDDTADPTPLQAASGITPRRFDAAGL